MRTCDPALKAWKDAGNNIAVMFDLYTIILVDGSTTYRWTSAEMALVFGGNTYLPAGPLAPSVTRGDFNNAFLPTIDTLDITLTSPTFTIGGATLMQLATIGYFRGARVRVDHFLGPDVATALAFLGYQKLFEGRVGQPEPSGASVVLHCNAETITLTQARPLVVLQPSCNWAVYDANCGLSRAAFTLTGAASGVPTNKTIPTTSVALTAKAAGYFDLGFITFTSGALIGKSIDISTWSGTVFTLAEQLSASPAAGDTFTVVPGCHLDLADCTRFANLANFRGYMHLLPPEAGT